MKVKRLIRKTYPGGKTMFIDGGKQFHHIQIYLSKGEQFTLPEHIDEKTSLQYFERFWKVDLNNLIAKQNNLYNVQKS